MNKTSNGNLFLDKNYTNRPNARFPSNHRKIAQQVDYRLQSTYQRGSSNVAPNSNKKTENIILECEAEFKRKGESFRMVFPFSHANMMPGALKAMYEDVNKPLNGLLLDRFIKKGYFFNQN